MALLFCQFPKKTIFPSHLALWNHLHVNHIHALSRKIVFPLHSSLAATFSWYEHHQQKRTLRYEAGDKVNYVLPSIGERLYYSNQELEEI